MVTSFLSDKVYNASITSFVNKETPTLKQDILECYDEDTTVPSSATSSPIITQRPPQPTASTSLDHLWSKQEKYEYLELRLMALEDSERQFNRRLELLDDHQDYLKLYCGLLEKFNVLQHEFQLKEKQYQERIRELSRKPVEDKPSYEEKDGYLFFDTTMNGEVTHCKVKIPSPPVQKSYPSHVAPNRYMAPNTRYPSQSWKKSTRRGLYNQPSSS